MGHPVQYAGSWCNDYIRFYFRNDKFEFRSRAGQMNAMLLFPTPAVLCGKNRIVRRRNNAKMSYTHFLHGLALLRIICIVIFFSYRYMRKKGFISPEISV